MTWLAVARGELLRWYLTRAKHPFKNYVVGHYWSWFAKRTVWVRYDADLVVRVTLSDYVQQRIFFDGYYERPLIDWLRQELGPHDVFWDVGANIGAVTLVAARHCRHVVSFEPDPRSADRLEEHLRVNQVRNVTVVRHALSDHTGRTSLYQAPSSNTGMTSLISGRSQKAGVVDVGTLTGDDFVADHPDLAPALVKIDVEGAEHLVLAGMHQVLASRHVRALVFEDRVHEPGEGDVGTATAAHALGRAGYTTTLFAHSDGLAHDGTANFIARPATALSNG